MPSTRSACPPQQRRLIAADGVGIKAVHLPGPAAGDLVVVVCHGFSGRVDKPANRRVSDVLNRRVPLVTFDFRGHGGSGGQSTLGDREVLDLAAAVRWARALGYQRVAVLGFSMGGAVAVRYAAGAQPAPAAVVDVSGPAFWNYRGTAVMRRLAFGVEHPLGRLVVRHGMGTDVVAPPWPQPWPAAPAQAAHHLAPMPLLVVHGRQDQFFPEEHPRAIVAAARAGARQRGVADRTDYWLDDFGHAEAAIPEPLLERILDWTEQVTS